MNEVEVDRLVSEAFVSDSEIRNLDIGSDVSEMMRVTMNRAADSGSTSRYRRVVVGAAAAFMMVAGPVAAGVIPNPVDGIVREVRSWGFNPTGKGERVAVTEAGEMTYEVWVTPLEKEGRCVYERVLRDGVELDHGGSSQCVSTEVVSPSREKFGVLAYPERVLNTSNGRDPGSLPRHSIAFGQLPPGGIAAIVNFDDGSSLTIKPQVDGFFITAFPGIADKTKIVNVQAIDDRGVVVAQG